MDRLLHIDYIKRFESIEKDWTYFLTEHLVLNGMYWGATSLALLGRELDKSKIIEFLVSCQKENGGFAVPGHDAHLTHTLSALQLCALYDGFDRISTLNAFEYVYSLWRDDGYFVGDEWGEIDTRFVYCGIQCLALLNRLDAIDKDRVSAWIERCKNFDGGYGRIPMAESHAAQVFCCVGTLSILGRLEYVDRDLLGHWLAERQLPCGGLNGRPEKLEDVCYSWWVLSSLAMIGRIDWIDKERLKEFITSCQDKEFGGFSDRGGNYSDVFHTLFGLAGLSLMGFEDLEKVDPSYCLPVSDVERLKLPFQRLSDN